ncbi:MAG: hypothetical protein K2X35_04545 [Bryobacteraceae bacterium]|nr:hypothetical protein [Bryobacteraceae bacterium]
MHAFQNRLAKEGEDLVLTRFPGGSLGFASPDQVSPSSIGTWWGRLMTAARNWSTKALPATRRMTAVCLPPGARLTVHEIPKGLQQVLGVGKTEEVVFAQLGCEAYTYRDALQFPVGRPVLLQRLPERLRVTVVSLTMPEPQAQPETAGVEMPECEQA